jgi:hypothetical protein
MSFRLLIKLILVMNVNARRRENKIRALSYFGIKVGATCPSCGNIVTEENILIDFEFHHLKPTSEKDCAISKLLSNKWSERIEKELKKCAAICINCHRRFSLRVWDEAEPIEGGIIHKTRAPKRK